MAIIFPALKSRRSGEDEDVWLNRVFTKAMNNPNLTGKEFDDVDDSELPSREFRNAWRGSKGSTITIDSSIKEEIENEKLIDKEMKNIKRIEAIKNLKDSGKIK